MYVCSIWNCTFLILPKRASTSWECHTLFDPCDLMNVSSTGNGKELFGRRFLRLLICHVSLFDCATKFQFELGRMIPWFKEYKTKKTGIKEASVEFGQNFWPKQNEQSSGMVTLRHRSPQDRVRWTRSKVETHCETRVLKPLGGCCSKCVRTIHMQYSHTLAQDDCQEAHCVG